MSVETLSSRLFETTDALHCRLFPGLRINDRVDRLADPFAEPEQDEE